MIKVSGDLFIEKYIRGVINGAPKQALGLFKYWKRKGFEDSEAEKRALNQAMGTIKSAVGTDLKKAKDILQGWNCSDKDKINPVNLCYWRDKLIELLNMDIYRVMEAQEDSKVEESKKCHVTIN